MKNLYRIISLVCIVVMVSVSVPVSVMANKGSDTTESGNSKKSSKKNSSLEESIKKKQEEIKKAEEEREKLKGSLTDVKKVVQGLEKSKEDLETYVTQLDQNLTGVEEKITKLEGLISEKEGQITETKADLAEAEKVEQNQYDSMKKRIKAMYEKGNSYYLEILFSSKSFGDFVNNADYIEKISEYDSDMLDKYIENKEYIATCKAELEAEEALLQDAKAQVEEERGILQTLISEKEKEIYKFEGDIAAKEKAIKEFEADIAAQNATIEALERAVAEEKRQLAGGNTISYDGGMFKWPAPQYTRISCEYGNRIHPILGIPQFHNGIDIAAPGGSPILAAYDGIVVAADYTSAMGNYVMINHGDGLYTVYMHASALYVKAGDTVAKGKKIAAVGSTGRSTGNHLHFSVRLNGSYVSPWNYLKQ